MKASRPDFDHLASLAQNEPEQFEYIRSQLCLQLIERAPLKVRQRLRGLQFTIDMQRQLAKNPLDACIRVSKMMHESLSQLNDVLHGKAQNRQQPKAEIIRFPRK